MSGGASAREASLPLAAAYSVLYGLAISADHLTTTEVIARGGVETNFLLASADGRLAEARAMMLFLWLFPAMLWLCRLGYRRSTGHTGISGLSSMRCQAVVRPASCCARRRS